METLDQKDSTNISENSVRTLGSAQGWVMAAGILMAIGSLFTLIGSFGIFAYSALGGLLYLIIAAGIGFLAYLAITQGTALGTFKITKSAEKFDQFATAYANYWKWTIIISIVMVVLSVIIGMVMANQMNSMMMNRYNF